MKRLLCLMLISVSLFTAGCDKSDGEDETIVKEARDTLDLSVPFDDITESFSLPVLMDDYPDVQIDWESSHPEYVSEDGMVIRPEYGTDDRMVTLKAILTLNGARTTKEFLMNVTELEQIFTFEDYKSLHEEANLNDFIEVSGIISTAYDGGMVLTDNTNYLVIDSEDIEKRYELGDEVSLKGFYQKENTLYYLDGVQDFTVESSDNTWALSENALSVETINTMNPEAPIQPGTSLTTRGEIRIEDDGTIRLDSLNTDASVILHPASASDLSQIFSSLNREIVDIPLVYFDKNDEAVPRLLYSGTEETVDVLALDYEDAFNEDISENIKTLFSANQAIRLPDEGVHGTQFTGWTSSHPDLLDNDGKVVAIPESSISVTYSGQANLRQYEKAISFTVNIAGKALPISDVLKTSDGTMVHAEGIVLSVNPHDNGFFLQDDQTGEGLYVRTSSTDRTQFDTMAIGNKVSIYGEAERYKSYSNNQKVIGGAIRLINNDYDNHQIQIVEDKTQRDIIEGYNSYDLNGAFDQPGGGTDSMRYTLKNISLESINFLNNVLIENEGLNRQLIFDLSKAEGLAVDDFEAGMTVESITFTTETIHFENYRVVDVVIE